VTPAEDELLSMFVMILPVSMRAADGWRAMPEMTTPRLTEFLEIAAASVSCVESER
jgi:hypothetical protein